MSEDKWGDIHHAVSLGLTDLRHADSPIAAIGEKLHRFNTGEWTDDDFRVIEDRSEIDDRLAADDMGATMLFVEPLMPSYYKYKDVRIIGGDGWWTLEDGEKFKVLDKVLDYIDENDDKDPRD